MKKPALTLVLLLTIALSITACTKKEQQQTNEPPTQQTNESKNQQTNESTNQQKNENTNQQEEGSMDYNMNAQKQLAPPEKGEQVAIMTTNYGEIKIKFFPQYAPKAVENFITHSKEGYYNGVIFHRIIPNFMIQGGDPKGTGTGGQSIWGKPFEDEFDPNVLNYRGALSMANAGPNTNGSQFFIVQNPTIDAGLEKQLKDAGYPQDLIDVYKQNGGTPWLDFRHSVFGQVYEGMDVVDNIVAAKRGPQDKPVNDITIEKIEITTY